MRAKAFRWSGLVVVLCAALTCGGSSTSTITGQGPAGIAGATVCLDANDNLACDTGETSAQTDEDGAYSLEMKEPDQEGNRLLWTTDDDTVDSATGSLVGLRYIMVSAIGSSEVISAFTTILSVQDTVDEAALKTSLGIAEEASLLGGYAPDGEIAAFVDHLDGLYAGLYVGAADDPLLTTGEIIDAAVATIIDDAALIADYVDEMESDEALPPSNAPQTQTAVGDEIFQALPVDASTMSPGIGMNEITRKVVQGAYCLSTLQSELTPQKALCQNTRNYFFRLIKSEKDLREVLNVGGGLDLGTQVVQGSLEGRFVNEMHKDSSSIYALIRAEYVLCGYKIFDVSMDSLYMGDDPAMASYTSNYEDFRSACGDRYLDTVATGGAYYGMLKIMTNNSDHKKDLTVKLEGKYGKAGISVSVKGDLESSVSEVLKDENITITVGSRGVSPQYLGLDGGEDQLIDNLEDFFDAADQFLDAISDPENDCHDDAVAWQNCAYTASFADYATVSHASVRNATQKRNLIFTTKLMGLYEDYKVLDAYITDILTHSSDYDWTGHTRSGVYGYKSYLYRGRLIMDSAFNKCLTDFAGCTNNAQAQSLKTFNEILTDMPFEIWKEPQDCKDIQRLQENPADTDGAMVSMGGDFEKMYQVSCRKMDTSEPETYLDLVNTSGSTSTPSYNSAVNVNADDSETATIYRKVRINVNFDNVEIVYDQDDEVETYPASTTDIRLGTAMDCNQTTGRAQGNIDLTGTNFQISPIVAFEASLAPKTAYQWVSTPMTFDDAKTHAESLGGRLVEFDDAVEFATLRQDLIDNHGSANSWVGMRRLDTSASPGWKQMKWIYKDTNITSAEWQAYFHTGEPNNAGGNEHCVHFWSDAMLNDWQCSRTLPFYVEFNYTEPTGSATFSSDRTSVDVEVSGAEAGVCAEIKPTVPIRLIYTE